MYAGATQPTDCGLSGDLSSASHWQVKLAAALMSPVPLYVAFNG